MKQDPYSRKRKNLLLAGKVFLVTVMAFGGTFAFNVISKNFLPRVQADSQMDIWWPTNNAKVSGLQPFKAALRDKNVSDYVMTWSVDGGQQNPMADAFTDSQHKEAAVDLTSWTWKGSGPYHVTFRATDKSGAVLGESSVDLYGPEAAQAPKTVVAGTTTPPTTDGSVLTGTIAALSGVQTVAAQAPAPTSVSAPAAVVQATQPANNAPAFLAVITPATNTSVQGLTAFRASVKDMNPTDYAMYWQVDGGQRNVMFTSSYNGSPIKEASVDVSSWNWRGSGPYKISFTAEKDGKPIATSDVTITVGTQSSVTQTQPATNNTVTAAKQTVAPTTQTATPVTQEVTQAVAGNPLSGLKFFVNPNSNAKATADSWRQSRPDDAYQMDKIATSPEAIWLGGWSGDVKSTVASKISAAKSQGAVPVFIAYNIPNRDCGSYSAGGVNDASSYKSWIQQIAAGLGGGKAVVVLEPDSLSLTDCLSAQQKTDRFAMISDAVSILKGAGAAVYIDAGHPNWISADDMASRLQSAGIGKADGFALNVSNFYTTSDNINYGTQISGKVGGKHFIVDTARNGAGPAGDQWCNPSGRALGNRATANTGNSLVDAFLWLKNPGESDGNCNGGPSAGTWWPEYALDLAKRSAI